MNLNKQARQGKPLILSIMILIAGLFTMPAYAQTFTSGVQQATLIELYTSEGCSSCPPAERYLNTFRNHPGLWTRYIPVALHVDYWDYLGWKDRFASSRHTLRQRQFARINGQSTIYTPGFFVNGRPWRKGLFGRAPTAATTQVGKLTVTLEGSKADVHFTPATAKQHASTLTLAVLGMGLTSSIRAGEREGSVPEHDFVVLNHAQYQSRDQHWSVMLPKFDRQGATQLALVAWVSAGEDPRAIQALGGYLE